MIDEPLREIISRFSISGEPVECRAFGSGHIHDTYLVRTAGGSPGAYILQKINNKVFRDVPAMMENILRVTRHLKYKLASVPGTDPLKETLTIVPALNGASYHKDENEGFWRMLIFIEPHQSFDIAADPSLVKEAGKAYGRFMNLLSDLGGEPLHETIPGFHDIDRRLKMFEEAMRTGNKHRIKEAPGEIRLIRDRAEEMTVLSRLSRDGKIPLRITHNDTKITNILFSPEGKAMCVIDLDTVMPGLVQFDFGDAMRTFTNTAAEDEQDLNRVSMNLGFFESFAAGYLESASAMLSPVEKEYLAFGAKYFTYLHVLRFLTDYLMDDVYYKIHYPQHNLVRAKNQRKLLESMDDQYDKMRLIVDRLG